MKSTSPAIPDLLALDTVKACNVPARVELEHPVTRKGLGVFIHVLGKDSDDVAEHIRDRVNGRIREDVADRRRGKDAAPRTVEKIDAETVETLTMATFASGKPWETVVKGEDGPTVLNFIRLGDEDLSFTPANISRLYAEQKWIRTQIDEAVADLELFIKA